jgi:hypothetical protein
MFVEGSEGLRCQKSQRKTNRLLPTLSIRSQATTGYVFVEGVGECRANFMHMVEGIDNGEVDVLVVAKAELLFIDTSPLWMEKFIATVKRHHILIADATRNREYDLSKPEDEEAFRALGKK